MHLASKKKINSSLLTKEVVQATAPGESLQISGFEVIFKGVKDVQGPNYAAMQGQYEIRKDGDYYGLFQPEKRRYFATGRETTEAAISSGSWYDLYVVINGDAGDGRYVSRVYHKPLVPWLWTGCGLLILGGLLSLSDRRLRVGAPKRSHKTVSPSEVPAE